MATSLARGTRSAFLAVERSGWTVAAWLLPLVLRRCLGLNVLAKNWPNCIDPVERRFRLGSCFGGPPRSGKSVILSSCSYPSSNMDSGSALNGENEKNAGLRGVAGVEGASIEIRDGEKVPDVGVESVERDARSWL